MFRNGGHHQSVVTSPLTDNRRSAGSAPASGPSGGGSDIGAPAPEGRRRRRRWPWILLGLFVVVALLIGGGVVWAVTLPIPNPHPQLQATLVYGSDGSVIGEFDEQNRVDVPLSAVPKVVIDAVISTEDRHFWSEGALNPVSTARAAIHDITGSGGLQGGSTITQQYVKQAYLTPKRTISRKIEEAVVAWRLAQRDSKQKILDGYLNTIYWGRGAYGIQAAAQAYFGRNVGQLDLPEAALLAGMIREPELADPAHDATLARKNQTETLAAMVRDHHITEAQARAAAAVPFSRYVIAPGSAATTRTAMGAGYFLAAVRDELYQKYGRQVVDGGGLRVTTTLDPKLQAAAYAALYGKTPTAVDPAKGDPSAAAVSVDNQGRVRALVGGQDHSLSSVDLALGAAGGGSGRQAGSTFKAFMLAAVISEGYSVQSQIPAPPQISIPDGTAKGGTWKVTNYEGEAFTPTVSLIDATAKSINTVYAQVVETLGAAKLDSMAEAMGISSKELPHPYLSQVLGTAPVSPLEMAAAYATFADGGVYHSPLLVTRVTTAKGKAMPLPVAPTSRRVLTPPQAAVADYVLQQVVNYGTGTAAAVPGTQVAGKTGTTDTAGDAWFDGYTPNLTTAVWMGYASSEKSMDGFRGLTSLAGGTIPAEMWHQYMTAALAAEPQLGGQFPAPPSLGGKPLVVTDQSVLVPPTTTPYHYQAPPTTSYQPPATTAPPATMPTVAPPSTGLYGGPVPTTAPPATTPPSTAPPTTASTTTTSTTTVPAGGATSGGTGGTGGAGG